MTSRSLYFALGLALVPAVAISCAGDVPTTPESLVSSGPELARMPGPPGSASCRLFYKVKLAPVPGSDARGMVHIDEDGIINYEATRSLADLRAAWNTAFGTSLQTDEELLAVLDLDDRNIHEHLPFGPPFPAVNCGPMDRVN